MKVRVYAKLNLSLNVYPKLGEFYSVQGKFHSVDSVVTSVDVFDVVTVKPHVYKDIIVNCNADVPDLQNSAYRAATAFQNAFQTDGCQIDIKKGIPVGAGMGGSSADAAAVIYCLCKLHKVPLNSPMVHVLCSDIGSDVYYMLHGGLARLCGKGDDVSQKKLLDPLYFALTTFPTSMSAAEVYAAFDKLPQKPTFRNNDRLVDMLQMGFFDEAVLCFGNNLQPAALSLSSWAEDYLRFCSERGIVCNMTGSGSAFYIACSTKSDATVLTKLLRCNGFDTRVCKSVKKGIK
ncbi:MAG: hypothetical protein NC132_05705 [Corallococcus sp.]|nr:hypothetical protein [Corallococcus sp.]MCM1360026.1 hypothetical protein [Corallococcus sp.]MCM1395583.1 hypothetical protein [Corallococcus sp.]